MMKNFHKSQMLKLSLIASLLVAAPLISSSLRGTYLYFIFNLLIIALGVEAGLLSSSSNNPFDHYDKKTTATLATTADEKAKSKCTDHQSMVNIIPQKKDKMVEKCSSQKIASTVVKVHYKVKKCPSTPSLFFIGGYETEAEELEIYHPNDHYGDDKELYNKAETFIGNFYKQLKMQREESWKRIHGFYHKTY